MSRVLVWVVRRTLVAGALLAAGCATYRGQRPLDPLTPVDPKHPVWIWSDGVVKKWYAVIITPDSVSGVQYELPETCDLCRSSLPRSQVDSMKVGFEGHHVTAQSVTKGVGFTAAALTVDYIFELVWCVVLFPRSTCHD